MSTNELLSTLHQMSDDLNGVYGFISSIDNTEDKLESFELKIYQEKVSSMTNEIISIIDHILSNQIIELTA